MARKQKGKPKTSRGGISHIRLYPWLTDCPAWKALTPLERALLIAIWGKHRGNNNGEIGYSNREAKEELRCGPVQACKAFKSLQEKGFIVCTEMGTFHRKDRLASTWRLTMEPYVDEPPTKDFMSWSPTDKK